MENIGPGLYRNQDRNHVGLTKNKLPFCPKFKTRLLL